MKSSAIGAIQKALLELAKPFVSRSEEAKVIVLTMLTKEHAVLIGEPGTAKSALIRRAAQIFGMKCFTYLLTKFTEPSELFGPLDLNALKEGKYVRITTNKLPDAELVFLDEIFKANSAILNTLLTIMNERLFYDGYTEIRVKLWSLFGASNEVPEDPELEALYDRFLIRHYVKPLSEDNWANLLRAVWRIEQFGYDTPSVVVTRDQLESAYSELFTVEFEHALPKILKIFGVLESKGIHLSDRRKGKALKVIAAHALLHNRKKVTEEDILAVKYIAPQTIEDFDKVNVILAEELRTPYKFIKELEEISSSLREVEAYISSFMNVNSSYVEFRLLEVYRDLEVTRDRVLSMMKETEDERVHRKAREVLESIARISEKIKMKLEAR